MTVHQSSPKKYLHLAAKLHPGKVHLHLWPVFNAINGLVAFVETHDPVRFPLRWAQNFWAQSPFVTCDLLDPGY